MDRDSKSLLRKWLDALQQESWQLELIISGFAIYGLFEAKEPSYEYLMTILNTADSGNAIGIISTVVSMVIPLAIEILILNLVCHVILRGLWIGTIGLRYVSKDINYNDLKYSSVFENYARNYVGDFDDYIEKLEKLCSIIFAYSFLLVFLIMSFFCFFIPILFCWPLVEIANENKSFLYKITVFYGLISYLMCGIITAVDLLLGGIFRKAKDPVLSKIYLPIYRFIGIITLSFLYRPMLYNFLDNKYTRKVLLFTIPYTLLSIFISEFEFNKYTHFPSVEYGKKADLNIFYYLYEDERQKHGLPNYSNDETAEMFDIIFSNYQLENNYPSLFVRWKNDDRNFLLKKKNIKGFTEHGYYFVEPEVHDSSHIYYQYQRGLDSLNNISSTDSLIIKEIENQKSAFRDSIKANSSIYRNPRVDKQKEILNIYRDLMEIKIDGVEIEDSKLRCLFYKYPHTEYKGVSVSIDMSFIDPGFHDLSFKTLSHIEKDSFGFEDVKLPFIKPDF